MQAIEIVGSNLAFGFDSALAIFASLFFFAIFALLCGYSRSVPGTVVISIPSFLRLLCLFAAIPFSSLPLRLCVFA